MILERFRRVDDVDLFEQWMSVEQTGSVAEYRREFVIRLNYLGVVDELVMLGAFLMGLCEEVKSELWVLGPTDLDQAREWAERIDWRLFTQSWLGRRHGQGRNYSISLYKNQIQPKYPIPPV